MNSLVCVCVGLYVRTIVREGVCDGDYTIDSLIVVIIITFVTIGVVVLIITIIITSTLIIIIVTTVILIVIVVVAVLVVPMMCTGSTLDPIMCCTAALHLYTHCL